MSTARKNPWKTLSSEVVHKNNWFSVRKDQVIRPDGQPGEYNVVDSPGPSFIVALDDDNAVYLIGQFRYPTGGNYSLELPAGSIDDQTPLEAAKRELQEETGLVAAHWKALGTFHTANGFLSESTRVFLATGLTQTEQNEQAEEGIQEVIKLPLEKVFSMIKNGEFTDGQSIAALMFVALELGLVG